MKFSAKPMSVQDVTLPSAIAPSDEVLAWQKEQLAARHALADKGLFASSDAVKAVIRKFVPNE
jgi:hypothetical protein